MPRKHLAVPTMTNNPPIENKHPTSESDAFHDVANRCWDVVVVGAGPAGAIAARQTSMLGLRTLLVDKASFPRFKVCGCCLNQRSLSTLAGVGLGKLVEQLGGVDYDRIVLAQHRTQVEIALPIGKSLSREAFDAALISAARKEGAVFLPKTTALLDGVGEQSRRLQLGRDAKAIHVEAKVVLAADGLGGRLFADSENEWVATRSRIGAGTIVSENIEGYARRKIYMACGELGYVGVVRLEDGRLDVAAAFDATVVRQAGGLAEGANLVLESANLPTLPLDCHWKGTPMLTRRKRKLGDERILVLGDAAGYVEPFTGEGIAWALSSGVAVANLAEQAVREWTPEIVTTWERLHRKIVRRRQSICRWTSLVVRRPWLTRFVIKTVRLFPALARPFTGRINEVFQAVPCDTNDPH